jgi:signal transduction histidine kinase
MTATLQHQVAALRRANDELQQRLHERTAELGEAQAQKAAMAELMEVINASPGNLTLVFDAMLEKATRLGEAELGILWVYDGRVFSALATCGVSAEFQDYLRENPQSGNPGSDLGRSGSGFLAAPIYSALARRTLERDFADTIAPIELAPQDITRVCLNLFGNGFYAATKRQREGSDPAFKPTLKVSTRDLGDAVEVQVRDNGVGIGPEIKDKLFQPFFTTKPTGEGTGLGLSISYDIVTQQHGGTITVDSRVGEFTEFSVQLPRTQQTAMAEAAS